MIILLLIILIIPFSVLAWGFTVDALARMRIKENTPCADGEDVSFTVLIPAHNEEACIAGVLESLKRQTYRNFDAFIIADCCTDGTKDVAARFPDAEIIDKTTASTCKGDALNYGLRFLRGKLGDVAVILDADSTVNPEFLEKLNEKYRAGSSAVMADTDILNPGDSIVTGWYTVYWKMVSEMSRRSHSETGLSCNLCGSGMTFRRELLRETVTITEDVEYFMALGSEGVRIDYAGEAKVFQEQPSTARDMFRQLYRWMNGVRSVNRVYRKNYLKSLFRDFSLLKLDAFMTSQTCSANSIFTVLLILFSIAVCLFLPEALPVIAVVLVLSYLITLGVAVTVTRRCRLHRRIKPAAIPTYFLFLIAMSLTYFYAIIVPGNSWMKVDRAERNEQKN